jgi:hypothetical protein
MSQTIPPPRDGANPVPENTTRPRPWPAVRRLLFPLVAAGALLLPAGQALACTTPPSPPKPPCQEHHFCKPRPTPTESTPTQAPTTPVETPTTPAGTPSTPTATAGGSCEGDTDTCGVVTGSPAFTG